MPTPEVRCRRCPTVQTRAHGVRALLLALILAGVPHGRASASPAPLAKLSKQFSRYDPNRDGNVEIQWARSLRLDRKPRGACRGTVLVVVEPRLLSDGRKPRLPSLQRALRTYADDLAAEGWRVLGVAMQVYDGPLHQDGRTVLAMREYLQALKALQPDLAGAVLVGDFPEAMLVRQYNWRQLCETTLTEGGKKESFGGRKVARLRSVAEMIAFRSELPLCDLDGNWERLYHEGPEDCASVLAIYPDAAVPQGAEPEDEWLKGGPTAHYEVGKDRYSDFFFVNDGRYTAEPAPGGGLDVRPLDDQRDEECSQADKQRGNRLARPDILVSRVNPRHIALRPKTDVRGVNGEGLLDAKGVPQAVTFASEKDVPRGISVWERAPVLERRLLREYFDRNHRCRRGQIRDPLKPASAAYGLGSFMPELREAQPEWKAFNEPGYDLAGDGASLLAVVQWLKRPAVLRALSAHSDPWGAHFGKVEDARALEKECGGQAWAWNRQGAQLVPTLGAAGKLDFAILRTLWQNGVLPDTACLYLHSGCEAIAPGGATSVPYNHPDYAYWQGAESLLFYARGLALVGRAKVFYDFPTDFAKVLREGKTFGEAWAHYFDVESAEPDVRKVGGGIGRKRAYFWSVLGDWTLRLGHGS